MKQNTQHNHINKEQPVELEIYLPFQAAPFTVTGDYEEVLPTYLAYERTVKPVRPPRRAIAKNLGNVASRAVEGVKSDVEVLAFDFVNGTSFRQELKRKREYQKKVDYARRLGLL